jgi:hypothetical protein
MYIALDPALSRCAPQFHDLVIAALLVSRARIPVSRHYDRGEIDESKGERWFCTAEEAAAAGWRAPSE